MKRLETVWMRFFSSSASALLGVVLIWAMAPVGALAAGFDSFSNFDPTTLPGVDLVIDSAVPVLEANDPLAPGAMDVQITGTSDLCILIGRSTTCQASVAVGQTGPISFLVTLKVAAIHTPLIDPTKPFTLLLSDLNSNPGYARSDVTVDLTPAPIVGLDTTAVPNFNFDPANGVNGFDPFVVVQDNFFGASDPRFYIGWTVMLGDSVSFKYDLANGPILGFTPALLANAIPVVVPEPGTTLLMGLGLMALSGSARRRA